MDGGGWRGWKRQRAAPITAVDGGGPGPSPTGLGEL
jgi:hypothetical protein